jgi:Ion channel
VSVVFGHTLAAVSEPHEAAGPAEDQARPHVVLRLLRSFVSTDSYGLVLVLIVVTYVLAVSVSTGPWTSIVLYVQIATVWITLRTAQAKAPVRFIAFLLMAYAAVAGVANAVWSSSTRPGWLFLASGLLYLIAPFQIVRHLAIRRTVDQETMLGAIAAYLLFGMMFAFAYRTVGAVQGGDFFGSQGDGTLAQSLFFSFTTLTTTGYGNLVPAGNPGQTMAVSEMILGQLFLITALGKVVSAWRPRRWSAESPSDGA